MTFVALEALVFGLGRLAGAARARGDELVLLTGDRDVYRHELSQEPDCRILDVDTHDVDAVVAAVRRLDDVRGLVTSTDTWAVTAADAAHRLGLPGTDPAVARLLRDKGRVRERLHAAGLGPAAVPATGADAVLDGVGLPAVLKDSAGTSSRGVWPVHDRAGLDAALAAARTAPLNGSLVAEPFLAGPVYSVETLTWGGETRLLAVTSRQMSALPAVREEASALPVALPSAAAKDVEDRVGRWLAATGFDRGFAHVEYVDTVDGPQLVEINPRVGGALVAEGLSRVLGTPTHDAELDVALGRRPGLLDHDGTPRTAVGFALVYADAVGRLRGWSGLDALGGYPGAPRWFPVRFPGDDVEHLADQRGCTGIVLAEGSTAELALHRATAAAGAVRPLLDPPPED